MEFEIIKYENYTKSGVFVSKEIQDDLIRLAHFVSELNQTGCFLVATNNEGVVIYETHN